jgi:hypothetical protein
MEKIDSIKYTIKPKLNEWVYIWNAEGCFFIYESKSYKISDFLFKHIIKLKEKRYHLKNILKLRLLI